MSKTPAWQRKEGQNPEGGLNARGRASARAQGSNLKAPVKGAPKTLAQMRRKGSFLSRMGAAKGPMKDEKGRPTRLALSLSAWGAPRDKAKARAMGQSLLKRYKAKKESQRG